jgi:mono/diheme cytochrome c family protein
MPHVAKTLVGEERSMMRQGTLSVVLAGLALVLAATPGWAQSDDAAATETAESGQDLYFRLCALCHGLEGYGNGPLADAMKVGPTDLTRLAAQHGGEFPSAKIADVVRNGGGVLGHGSPAMPAWGLYFAEKRKPEVARGRIKALVDYIESIQQK